MNREQEALVRDQLTSNATMQGLFNIIRDEADTIFQQAPSTYQKSGKRLLSVSRQALQRIMYLAFVYRITGETHYAERAMKEMDAVAAFSDWNPSHFLDVAEMTAALAIGYDWLLPVLSDEQKELIRRAILDKGIAPSYAGHDSWAKRDNNWNQVCHGGLVMGALVLAEQEPELAAKVIQRALDGLPYAMETYEPDGIYVEGPSYWEYGTTYNVLLIAALESALGTDYGLADRTGFAKTGTFPLFMTGPTGNHFNFSDCGNRGGPFPAMFWFARRYQDSGILWWEHFWLDRMLSGTCSSSNRFLPLILLWWDGAPAQAPAQPLHWKGEGLNPISIHRTSWTDPEAVFLAVKAGTPFANHGHMDIGSFILEADGVRWAMDLGGENYGALEARKMDIWNRKQTSDRWQVYRYHNRSHNTLFLDDIGQQVNSQSAIVKFSDESAFPYTIVDMSEAYKDSLEQVKRGFALLPDHRILIQDEMIAPDSDTEVQWLMNVPDSIQITGERTALIRKGDKELRLYVLEPEHARITARAAASGNEWDASNPEVGQLAIHLTLKRGKNTLRVLLTPESAMTTASKPIVKVTLEKW